MPTNDFLPFGNAVGANVMAQSDYLALAARSNGFSSGTANSMQLNKTWRQASIMASMLAQFIVDQSGQNAVDDGTTATLEANLLTAIRAAGRQATILTDTGSANVYAAANTPALTALPATGYSQRVNIAHANTGASTYAPDGLAAKPIYGLGLQPLQGGELPVGVAVLLYLVQAGVNGGNGAWIIIESLGGASQVAPATQSQHAIQLGQVQQNYAWNHGLTVLTTSGNFTVPANVYFIDVELWSGGGGGGAGSSSGGAGGGGAGGYARKIMAVTPGQVIAGTVGGGGVINGGSGGSTSFNGISATGGGGGTNNASGSGGSGGIGSGGTINLTGGNGGSGAAVTTVPGGNGGGCPGGGGASSGGAIGIAGSGTAPGGAGGGGGPSSNGGSGGNGQINIRY